jgi:hypothetical protein
MLAARWHIERKPRRGRAKTVCGLLVNSPRRACVRSDGSVREFPRPMIVSPKKLWKAPIMNECLRCLNGWFDRKALLRRLDARVASYEEFPSGSSRVRMTTEELQARLARAEVTR